MNDDEYVAFRASADQLAMTIKEWVPIFRGLREALIEAGFPVATADQIVVEYSRHAFQNCEDE